MVNTVRETVWSGDTAVCNEGKADSRLLPVMPYRPTRRIFRAGDRLEVWLKCAGADTVVTASSYLRIPVTVKNLRLDTKVPGHVGKVGDKVFTDNAAGLVFEAGVDKMWCYYEIEKGEELVLGHVVAFNSRVLVAPYDDTE